MSLLKYKEFIKIFEEYQQEPEINDKPNPVIYNVLPKFNELGDMNIQNKFHLFYKDMEVGKAYLYVTSAGNLLILTDLWIDENKRDKGFATRFMKQLIKLADEMNITVALTPDGYKGSSKERLKKFYARFGFKMNTGKDKDYSISELMHRKAKS